MRAVSAFIFVASLAVGTTQESTTDSLSFNTNTIEPKTTLSLDPYIKRALLKALNELEISDNFTANEGAFGNFASTDSISTNAGNTDTVPTESSNNGIQIHSFVVNGQSAFANLSSSSSPALPLDSKISILGTTAGNVENQVTATLPTQTTFGEIFQVKETSTRFNNQQVRSINLATPNNDNSVIPKETTSQSSKPAPSTTSTTSTTTTSTTTTTTTTTPKPTHNNDGENIEDVDKKDVQVFQAPLVAAFTVHQDAQGLPKKVVPIFQQTSNRDITKPVTLNKIQSDIVNQRLPTRQNFIDQTFNQKFQNNDVIAQQLALQRQLQEKQRILEEQLRLLQYQQRQQEDILRKQQFLLQQKEKELQRQQQYLFEQEQLKRQQNDQRLQNNAKISVFGHQGPKNAPPQFPQPNNGARQPNSQVSIQQSVSLDQTNSLINQQQLPNREAVDFLLSLRNQQSEQFPLQDNHLPRGIHHFLQPGPLPALHQQNQLLEDPLKAKNSNRVFRQESGVGNFGFNQNQNFNRFNTFNPIFTGRFFPQQRHGQGQNDFELKQLLAQNGLHGKNNEDLNIVSKVLSLNHGVPLYNNISNNRLNFDNRRHVKPF